jgi:hypothetical protein
MIMRSLGEGGVALGSIPTYSHAPVGEATLSRDRYFSRSNLMDLGREFCG